MHRTIATTLSLALMCSSAAFAEDTAQQQQQQSQSDAAAAATAAQGQSDQAAASDASAQPAAGREQAMQDPTQMFVMETYSSNLFEIKAGELAAQRAQDDQTKQLARMLVQDHTQANQQLKQAAQSKQIQVQEQLDPVHQAKLQKLQKLPAQEFSRKFVNGQVSSHMMSVLEFRYQSQNLQDPQLKQWATQMLPKLEQHLQHATQIATKMAGGQAQPASAKESGQQQSGANASDPSGTSGQSGAGTSGQSGAGTSGQKSE